MHNGTALLLHALPTFLYEFSLIHISRCSLNFRRVLLNLNTNVQSLFLEVWLQEDSSHLTVRVLIRKVDDDRDAAHAPQSSYGNFHYNGRTYNLLSVSRNISFFLWVLSEMRPQRIFTGNWIQIQGYFLRCSTRRMRCTLQRRRRTMESLWYILFEISTKFLILMIAQPSELHTQQSMHTSKFIIS